MSKIKQVLIWITIIAVVGVCLNMIFGNNTMIYVEKQLIPGSSVVWYRFDTWKYIQQLTTSITNTTELELKVPTKHWITIDGFGALGHDLAVMVDYVILIINVLLYPLKIGGYALRFILALLGLNITDADSGLKWLGNMAVSLIGLSIPYI